MLKSRYTFLFVAIIVFVSACGVAHRLPQQKNSAPQKPESSTPTDNQGLLPAVDTGNYSTVEYSLRKAYHDWKGTPYEWGGTTIHGVDCSAFIQIVFNRYFDIELPRTTRQQINVGTEVDRQQLQPGDLIFFRTGRQTLHVGIMLDKPNFIHTSTSEGVTISSLNDYYWRSRYLKAKRVL